MRNHTYIIAEIGINHNGDIEIAKKLIDIAAFAGCNAVKFQKRTPEICVPQAEWDKMRDTPWGKMRYLDYKFKIEFGKDEYDQIAEHCQLRNIDWSASVWDIPSLQFIRQYNPPFNKVPSALMTNEELITAVAKDLDARPIYSTGMSTEDEVCWMLETIWLANHDVDPVIMHCNSSYPANVSELNLLYIKELMDRHGVEVGYSAHQYGLVCSFAAIALGATFLEFHITLDHNMWGTDQLSSVDPVGIIKLVRGARDIEMALGDGVKKVYDSEVPIRKKLRGT
jgi:N-acetylneuraminate synthase